MLIDMLVPICCYEILMHICTGWCTFETIPHSHLNSNLDNIGWGSSLDKFIVKLQPLSPSIERYRLLDNIGFSRRDKVAILQCAITLSRELYLSQDRLSIFHTHTLHMNAPLLPYIDILMLLPISHQIQDLEIKAVLLQPGTEKVWPPII